MKQLRIHAALLFAYAVISTQSHAADQEWIKLWRTPGGADLPIEYGIQGEYVGEIEGAKKGGKEGTVKLGAQVICLGPKVFHAVVYPGGLPGAGWDGKHKILMDGKLVGVAATFTPAKGNKRYLGGSPQEFCATKQFPPTGHKPYTATIAFGAMNGKTDDGKPFSMHRTVRVSPTMGSKPPKGGVVLFDGTSKKEFQGGRLDKKTRLLNTDGKDIRTVRKLNNYTMHIEFLLPFKPEARGQGRGNSGFYQIDMYEMQILDSFGLEGLDNECGGIYKRKVSDVNMCLPPLQWQAYDVEFTNAVSENGQKVKNARLTARLNGVVIHNDFEIPGKTGGSRRDPEGTPGPIKLQGHGNPLQFRNIWIVER